MRYFLLLVAAVGGECVLPSLQSLSSELPALLLRVFVVVDVDLRRSEELTPSLVAGSTTRPLAWPLASGGRRRRRRPWIEPYREIDLLGL